MTSRDVLRENHGIVLDKSVRQGSQRQVFRAKRLARDGRTAMPCAVKVYPFADLVIEPPKELLDEIRSLVRVGDSNYVVRLLDVIVERSFLALVLEECEQSFADLLEQRQSQQRGIGMARDECFRLCEQIARGLSDCPRTRGKLHESRKGML